MKKIFLLLLAVVFYSSCDQSKNEVEPQPNILFIEVDDLTAKYLNSFGADNLYTPNIDTLAMNGVVFENAVVQGVKCTPSRNSLITGLYPHNLNLYDNLDLIALPNNIWTFPKALQREGYKTIWVGKNHLIPNKSYEARNKIELFDKSLKIEMGFDDVYQSMGRAMVLNKARNIIKNKEIWKEGEDAYGDFLFKNNLLDVFIEEGGNKPTSLDPDTEYMDGYFTTMAIDKINEHKGEDPFFMWINFSGPHIPFDAPQIYLDSVKYREIPLVIDPRCESFTIPKELKPQLNSYNTTSTREYRRRYIATIAYMDDQVGRLIDFINNSRFSENTVIFFFSDHGIMTGDHGLMGKSTLFKEVLNPALIVSYPNKYKAKRIKTTVELLDLGKTVLDIAGARDSSLQKRKNGNSLLPLLSEKGSFAGNGFGFSEIRGIRSVFNGDYKYIDHPTTPILFNLIIDPQETQNRIKAEPEMAETMKKALEKWKQESGGPIPFDKYGNNINTNSKPDGMIYIKADSTQIGSESGLAGELPVTKKYIKGFFMDIHPVTVKEFRIFIQATNYQTDAEQFGNSGVFDFETGKWGLKEGAYWEYPQGMDFPKAEDDHPVTQVSWNDAMAYCKWAGKRLPSEFEWEHAARNAGKNTDQLYPWRTNYLRDKEGNYLANVWQGPFPRYNSVEDGYRTTSPVGAFGASPIGLQDMAGNVWEWCSNWRIPYDEDPDQFIPDVHSEKAQRGGSFLCDPKVCHGYRVSGRSGSTPETSLMNVGFRCVMDIPEI